MKFLIYIPSFSNKKERVRAVGAAVVRVADVLGADVEVKPRGVYAPHVYFCNGDGDERIPVYNDWGKHYSEQEVYDYIRNVIFALSFHSEYSPLKIIRGSGD